MVQTIYDIIKLKEQESVKFVALLSVLNTFS